MSRSSRLNTSFQERSDYEDIVQSIETRHRHDLAVHLYLAFLLHQVNPHFPGTQWTSWPPQPSNVLDPQMTTDAEDFVVDDLHYDGTEDHFYKEAANKTTGHTGDTRMVQLLKHNKKIPLRYRRLKLSSPKVTLVNEIHFLLQRKIKELARRANSAEGTVSLVDDSPLMRSIATRLANRMGKVIDRLSEIQRCELQLPNELMRRPQGTWQDVAIANFYNDKLEGRVDLHSHRYVYQKMRRLFHNVLYPYKYDPDIYVDETTGIQEEVPEFDVEENLRAIENEGLAPTDLKPAQELLENRRKDLDFKERMFLGLMDQAVREKQLSPERPGPKRHFEFGFYVPEGQFLREKRQKVFKQAFLQPKDFETGIQHCD